MLEAAIGLALDTRPGAYALVAAAVVGHMFPATRRFHGGKGVATMGGATLVLHPIASLALTAMWIAVRKSTGKASLASVAIAIGLPIALALTPAWEMASVVGLCMLVLLRHTDNIKRLLRGRELPAMRSR